MAKINLKKIKINPKKVGFFRFEKMNNDYLLTNDFGFYVILKSDQFNKFLEGNLDKKSKKYEELEEKGFLKETSFYQKEKLINACRQKRNNLFKQGPSLHIIVATLRCNFNCVYCQASSRSLKEKKYDMSLGTAKKTVDFIFNTPNPYITIEFQGGEPLTNWPVVKFIVEYAREKEKESDKKIEFALVSNLTLLTKKKLDFLFKNEVKFSTSLDGPEKIHNKNRPWVNNNSYQSTVKWIKIIKKERIKMGALLTVTKDSLKYPKQIIEEYLKFGFWNIHLRPVAYLGRSKNSQREFGYSAEEFINYWKKSMDYIISINKKRKIFIERESQIMIQRIMTNKNPGYTDLESPCGAVLGQMLYNYDGNIYTCDEGRMLEDDTFLIGNIMDSYEKIILNSKTKTMITASCLENTTCDNCVFKPYCGICPVKNYIYHGTILPQIINTDHCKIKKYQFRYIFNKLQDEEVRKIFESWVMR